MVVSVSGTSVSGFSVVMVNLLEVNGFEQISDGVAITNWAAGEVMASSDTGVGKRPVA